MQLKVKNDSNILGFIFVVIFFDTGISAVIANTEKGEKLLKLIDIQKKETDINQIIKYNKNIIKSTSKSEIRVQFFEYKELNGYGKAFMHFFREKRLAKLKRITKYRIKCIYNKILGRNKPLY